MTHDHWIILRLLRTAAQRDPRTLHTYDFSRSINYLIKLYGLKQLAKCIDQLRREDMAIPGKYDDPV